MNHIALAMETAAGIIRAAYDEVVAATKVKKLKFGTCKSCVCGNYPEVSVRSFSYNISDVHFSVKQFFR